MYKPWSHEVRKYNPRSARNLNAPSVIDGRLTKRWIGSFYRRLLIWLFRVSVKVYHLGLKNNRLSATLVAFISIIIFFQFTLQANGIYDTSSHPFWQVEDRAYLNLVEISFKEDLPKDLTLPKAPVASPHNKTKDSSFINAFGVDLNSDNQLEYFIEIPEFGGTGGRYYVIYHKSNSKWVSICSGQGSFNFRKPQGVQKWASIVWFSRGGGGRYSRVEHAFNNSKYSKIKHFIIDNGKVTVSH